MGVKAITTDYEHFADPKMGIVHYIEDCFKLLIQSDDIEAVQRLVDDTVAVSDLLYELVFGNEETGEGGINSKLEEYHQIKNTRAALEKQLQDTENALRDLEQKKISKFGEAEEPPLELVIASDDGPKMVNVDEIRDTGAQGTMDAEVRDLMDSMLTIENVMGPDAGAQELMRESGLIFNEEIEDAGTRDALEDDYGYSDGYYNDIEMESVDVDDGYQPIEPYEGDAREPLSHDVAPWNEGAAPFGGAIGAGAPGSNLGAGPLTGASPVDDGMGIDDILPFDDEPGGYDSLPDEEEGGVGTVDAMMDEMMEFFENDDDFEDVFGDDMSADDLVMDDPGAASEADDEASDDDDTEDYANDEPAPEEPKDGKPASPVAEDDDEITSGFLSPELF